MAVEVNMARAEVEADRFSGLKDMQKCAYVVATMLSTFEPGTWFYYRDSEGLFTNGLERQVIRILEEPGRPIIRKNLSQDISAFFSSFYGDFGAAAGLENSGQNFDFRTTAKTREVAEEAKQYLSKEDYEHLQELGRKLKVKKTD